MRRGERDLKQTLTNCENMKNQHEIQSKLDDDRFDQNLISSEGRNSI